VRLHAALPWKPWQLQRPLAFDVSASAGGLRNSTAIVSAITAFLIIAMLPDIALPFVVVCSITDYIVVFCSFVLNLW
jgi:hypothetical protein